jgi:hypothetical protein
VCLVEHVFCCGDEHAEDVRQKSAAKFLKPHTSDGNTLLQAYMNDKFGKLDHLLTCSGEAGHVCSASTEHYTPHNAKSEKV